MGSITWTLLSLEDLYCKFPLFLHQYLILNAFSFSQFDRALGRNSRRGRTIQSLASFYEDEDLQNTIEESSRVYRTYETQFDLVLVNNNFEKTFEQLREAVDALSTESQWVPINWVYSD